MQEQKGIIQQDLSHLLKLPEERLIIAERKHWFVLVVPLALAALFFIVSNGIAITFFAVILHSGALFLVSILAIFVITVSLVTKVIIDWYAHFYIVTTHRIVETFFIPLFSYVVNDVLFEQVRCTEVDVKMNGMINQFVDMGDIIITFDRPTHQEAFTISDIKNPHMVGSLVANSLDHLKYSQQSPQNMWFRDKSNSKLRFSEDIFQGPYLGVV